MIERDIASIISPFPPLRPRCLDMLVSFILGSGVNFIVGGMNTESKGAPTASLADRTTNHRPRRKFIVIASFRFTLVSLNSSVACFCVLNVLMCSFHLSMVPRAQALHHCSLRQTCTPDLFKPPIRRTSFPKSKGLLPRHWPVCTTNRETNSGQSSNVVK